MQSPVYLFDANVIIEAVRTKTWNALTGALAIETVAECAEECRRGDTLLSGYVSVSQKDLDRLARVHAVPAAQVATVLLREEASSLDPGERDLFARALALPEHTEWLLCSPDHASVRFAVAVGCGERLVSLEEALTDSGARPSPALREHFSTRWLSMARTRAMLG